MSGVLSILYFIRWQITPYCTFRGAKDDFARCRREVTRILLMGKIAVEILLPTQLVFYIYCFSNPADYNISKIYKRRQLVSMTKLSYHLSSYDSVKDFSLVYLV